MTDFVEYSVFVKQDTAVTVFQGSIPVIVELQFKSSPGPRVGVDVDGNNNIELSDSFKTVVVNAKDLELKAFDHDAEVNVRAYVR